MMSKDKILEALTKVQLKYYDLLYDSISCEVACHFEDDINEIKELLAQPEQTEQKQEPVAWMSLSDIEWMNIVNDPRILELTDGRHSSEGAVNLAVKMTEEKCKKNNSDSIPKREPLSEEWIKNNRHFIHKDVYFTELVRGIEKAHGIGGG